MPKGRRIPLNLQKIAYNIICTSQMKNCCKVVILFLFSVSALAQSKKWTLEECVDYALKNNINRLAEDHRRAKELGAILTQLPWIEKVEPVETNILIFSLKANVDEKATIEKFKQRGILISSMGQGKLRIVTHLDYKEVMHDYVKETLLKFQ